MKTTPTPKGARTDPGSYSWKLLLIKDARVHYVVLKQQPRTTHPTRTHKKANRVLAAAGKPETQVPGKNPGPVVSGPNSVPNTKPLIPLPHRSRTRPLKREQHPYWVPAGNRRPLFVDIPPVSTRRRTCVCATGVLLTTPPHRHNAWQGCCRCSLERR